MATKSAFSLKGDIQLFFSDATLKKANQQIAQTAARIQGRTQNVNRSLASLAGNVGTTFGLVAAGFGASAMAAGKFEESFVAVKKTLNIAGDAKKVETAFNSIAKSLLELTRISPVTAQELNQIAAVGGQLGIAANDIVKFTQVIQKLTIATNLGAEDAALAMARLQEITGRGVNELDNLGATLVDLGNNFAATESEITNASLQIATATSQVSGNLNNAAVDALAFSTALRAIGQPAQAGATAIVRLMTDMSQAVVQGGEDLDLFAKTAGMSSGEFRKLFGVDSTKAIALFVKGLDQSNIAGMSNIEVMERLGLSQVRTRKAILGLSKAHETLFEAIDTANNAFVENTALNLEAERRYDTLYSKIQQLKNIAQAGIIDFSQDNNSLEYAKSTVETLTNLTQVTMDNLSRIIKVIVPVTGTLFTLRTVFSLIEKNTANMAANLGLVDTSMKGIGSASKALNSVGFALGSGGAISEEDVETFGMDLYKGGRITTGDRIRQAIPSIFGKITGFSTGSDKRQADITRQSFFASRRGADAFMQNKVDQIVDFRGQDLEGYVDTLANLGIETDELAEAMSETNVAIRAGKLFMEKSMEIAHNMLANTGIVGGDYSAFPNLQKALQGNKLTDLEPNQIISKGLIDLDKYSPEEIFKARQSIVLEQIDNATSGAKTADPSLVQNFIRQINYSIFNMYSDLEAYFAEGLKAKVQAMNMALFQRPINPMEQIGLISRRLGVEPDMVAGTASGVGASYPGGFDLGPDMSIGPSLTKAQRLLTLGFGPNNQQEEIEKDLIKMAEQFIGESTLDLRKRNYFETAFKGIGFANNTSKDVLGMNQAMDTGNARLLSLINRVGIQALQPEDFMQSDGEGFRLTEATDIPLSIKKLGEDATKQYLEMIQQGGFFPLMGDEVQFHIKRLMSESQMFVNNLQNKLGAIFKKAADVFGPVITKSLDFIQFQGLRLVEFFENLDNKVFNKLRNNLQEYAINNVAALSSVTSVGDAKITDPLTRSILGKSIVSPSGVSNEADGWINLLNDRTEKFTMLQRFDEMLKEYNQDSTIVTDFYTQLRSRGYPQSPNVLPPGVLGELRSELPGQMFNNMVMRQFDDMEPKGLDMNELVSRFNMQMRGGMGAFGSISFKGKVFQESFSKIDTIGLNLRLLFNTLKDKVAPLFTFVKDIASAHYLLDASQFSLIETVTQEAEKYKREYLGALENVFEAGRGPSALLPGIPSPLQTKPYAQYGSPLQLDAEGKPKATRISGMSTFGGIKSLGLKDGEVFDRPEIQPSVGDFIVDLMGTQLTLDDDIPYLNTLKKSPDFPAAAAKIKKFKADFENQIINFGEYVELIKDIQIEIFRAVPESVMDIAPLDWASTNRKLIEENYEQSGFVTTRSGEESKVLGQKFRLGDLYIPNTNSEQARREDFITMFPEQFLDQRFAPDDSQTSTPMRGVYGTNQTILKYQDTINEFYAKISDGITRFADTIRMKMPAISEGLKKFTDRLFNFAVMLDQTFRKIGQSIEEFLQNLVTRIGESQVVKGVGERVSSFIGGFKKVGAQKDYNDLLKSEIKLQNVINKILRKRETSQVRLGDLIKREGTQELLSASSVKGVSDKQNIDNLLDSIYGTSGEGFFGKQANRKRRGIAVGGGLEQVNEVVALLQSSDDFFVDYKTRAGETIELNQSMLKSFTVLSSKVGRFTAVLLGMIKAFSLLGVAYLVVAPLVKMFSKIGAQSRGAKEFTNTLREVTDGMLEYRVELFKLSEAEKLRADQAKVIGGTTSEAYESIVDYIDKQNKALTNQRKQMSQTLGTSFLENIAENLLGSPQDNFFFKGAGGPGSYIDSVISQLATGRNLTEDMVRKQIAEPIGNALYNVLESGEIPTIGEIFNQVLFTEQPSPTNMGELSGFFTGFTREFLEKSGVEKSTDDAFLFFNEIFQNALVEGIFESQKLSAEEIARMGQQAGGDPFGAALGGLLFGEGGIANMNDTEIKKDIRDRLGAGANFGAIYGDLLGEVNQSIAKVINDYTGRGTKGTDFFAELGEGDFSSIGAGAVQQAFLSEISKQIRATTPNATDAQVGQAMVEFLSFYETVGAMTGVALGTVSELPQLLEKISPDAPMFQPLMQMLQTRIQELEQAGYVTADQMFDAQGNFNDMFKLFNEGMGKIEKETIADVKALNNTLGITAQMSAKLAIKMSESFKKMRSEISLFGKEVQQQQFTRRTLGDLINDFVQAGNLQDKLESDVSKLRLQGYQMLADRVLSLGPGGADLAKRFLNDSVAAVAAESQLRTIAPSDATALGVTSPLEDDKDFMAKMKAAGMNVVKGLTEGIESGYQEILNTFTNLGEAIIEKLAIALDLGSPSKATEYQARMVLKGLQLPAQKSPERTALLNTYEQLGKEIPSSIAKGIQNTSNLLNPLLNPQNPSGNPDQSLIPGAPGSGRGGKVGPPTAYKSNFNIGEGYYSGGMYFDSEKLEAIFSKFGANFSMFVGTQTNIQNKLDTIVANIYNNATDNITQMQEAWGMVTSLTNAERQYNSSILGVFNAKQSLAKTLREEASLTDRIADTKERLDKLEIEGKKGNITVKERVGILQQLLSLREMEKKAAGEYDARTALSIQQKEQEVANMALMFDRGVITQLDFQAAQEELSELKGEFKSDEDKELFFLQLADAEAEYKKTVEDAKKVDQSLISTREEYLTLLDEQERKSAEVTVSQDGYRASLENVVTTNMALNMEILKFNEQAGLYAEELAKIKGAYGEVTDEVNNLFNAVERYHNSLGKIGIDSATAIGVASGGDDLSEEVTAKAVEEELKQEAADQISNQAKTSVTTFQGFGDMIASQLDAFKLGEYFTELLNQGSKGALIADDAFLQSIIDESQQPGYTVNKYGYPTFGPTSDEKDRFLEDDSQILGYQKRLDYSNAERMFLQNMEAFVESIGINLERNAAGIYEYTQSNLDFVAENLPAAYSEMDILGFMDVLNKTNMFRTTSNLFPEADVISGGSGSGSGGNSGADSEQGKTPGTALVYKNNNELLDGLYYQTKHYGNITGAQINALLKAGMNVVPKVPTAAMGMRLPDMKMPQFKNGGRMQDHLMKRALVGEYGPEEIRFVPGSGFLVKPLTQGGRGNNTIVENLSVNVTGIPVDNASARKAALQIKKALQRLDREGRAGGGVRNT